MKDAKYENYIERVVREELTRFYDRDKTICSCDACYRDIMTRTLNRLPPMYVTSNIGHIMTMFKLTRDQLHAQVITELAKSIEQVRKKPRHAAEDKGGHLKRE